MAGEAHLTFNPGVTLGGTTVEFDPVQLRGTGLRQDERHHGARRRRGDLRMLSQEQLAKAKQAMEQIVAASLAHTQSTIRSGGPPFRFEHAEVDGH